MSDADTARIVAVYQRQFGCVPDFIARAPGRVNLIGEHTDYNGGFVLPCAIDRATTVAIGRADGTTITVIAADYDETRDSFAADKPFSSCSDPHWSNHVRGLHAAMRARGFASGGANIVIGGNVPQGAGLSSSASLGVALARALATLGGHESLDPVGIALIAQAAENDFVGVACGIMDQLVSASARAEHALLIDCTSLTTVPVPVPGDTAIIIIHSGIVRRLAGSAYNERREQCAAAARHYGLASLRDLDATRLLAEKGRLDPIAYRRARHVVTENARTLAAAEALASNDLARLGNLFAASHASMRDDFDITLPAIDALVATANAAIGADGGVRMTGGGFGGCVVVVTKADRAAFVRNRVRERYATPMGGPPLTLECKASAGASIVAG